MAAEVHSGEGREPVEKLFPGWADSAALILRGLGLLTQYSGIANIGLRGSSTVATSQTQDVVQNSFYNNQFTHIRFPVCPLNQMTFRVRSS